MPMAVLVLMAVPVAHCAALASLPGWAELDAVRSAEGTLYALASTDALLQRLIYAAPESPAPSGEAGCTRVTSTWSMR